MSKRQRKYSRWRADDLDAVSKCGCVDDRPQQLGCKAGQRSQPSHCSGRERLHLQFWSFCVLDPSKPFLHPFKFHPHFIQGDSQFSQSLGSSEEAGWIDCPMCGLYLRLDRCLNPTISQPYGKVPSISFTTPASKHQIL